MKLFFRFSMLLLLSAVLLRPGTLWAAEEAIHIRVDGILMEGEARPFMENGRVLVPLRAVTEYLNGEINWYPEERQVIGFRGPRGFDLIIGSSQAVRIDGSVYTLDAPAQISGGYTYVPLRFVSEALGCQVEWDAAGRTAQIITQELDVAAEVSALTLPGTVRVVTDRGEGSGFFYSRDGQVITRAALIRGAAWIRVKTHAGREYRADVMVEDNLLDLAKLRVSRDPGENFPVFRYFDDFSGLDTGEAVYAAAGGRPPAEALTAGVVRVKELNNERAGGINLYRITAAVGPAAGGGPLVKANGALAGVLCPGPAPDGSQDYVIPIEYVFEMRNRQGGSLTEGSGGGV